MRKDMCIDEMTQKELLHFERCIFFKDLFSFLFGFLLLPFSLIWSMITMILEV